MFAAVDVWYRDDSAAVGCVEFASWTDDAPARQHTTLVEGVSPYISGQFYLRELPCILASLEKCQPGFEAIVVDGFVWLQENTLGLGAHLYKAIDQRASVIGVAKT